MELGIFWGLIQFVVYFTLASAFGGEKTMIKVDVIEQLIKPHAKACYPPKVNKEQFLAEMIVALTTGRVANIPETKCFIFCVLNKYNLISSAGQVNIPLLNTTIANMTHAPLQAIIENNMVLCAATCDTADICINALKFGRCFAKQGLFVYVKLEESHFPTTKLPKNATAAKTKPKLRWVNLFGAPKVPVNGTLTTLAMTAATVAAVPDNTTTTTTNTTAAPAG